MSSKGLFIAGTDTGVGKTFITCALARAARDRKLKVGVMKPLASGSWDDSRALKKASGVKDPFSLITPYYFREPLAPLVAAEREKKKIEKSKILTAFRKLQKRHKFLLVEGSGGLLVPILESYNVLDLIRDLKLPTLLVARAGLGTLNHTLLSYRALRQKGIRVAAVVLNGYRGRTTAEETNPDVLRRLLPVPVVTHKRGDPFGGGLLALCEKYL